MPGSSGSPVTAGRNCKRCFSPLAKPRINTATTAEGQLIEEPDPRSHGQRMHDALSDVCDRLLRSDNAVPDSGGTPATVIVTIDLDDLLNQTGYAVTSDGTLIRTDTALGLADQADLYWAFIQRTGQILHLGRTRRIASRPQTIALYARDKGCSFPGCDTSPEWCRAAPHRPLGRGRPDRPEQSDAVVRLSPPQLPRQGWECRMNDHRLPEWLPPWWINPNRTPMINNRIRASLAATEHRRR